MKFKIDLSLILLILIVISGYCKEEFFLYPKYKEYLKKKDITVLENFFFKADTKKKIVVLSFDDGPSKNGHDLIQILTKYKVPAVFFLITKKINRYNIVPYKSSLFSLGIHTYNHLNYDKLTYKEINTDMEKSLQIFKKFKIQTYYFRPAYGVANKNLVNVLHHYSLKGILWSLDSLDWKISNQKEIINNVIRNVSPGSVILMHETRTKPQTLEIIIKKLQKEGYEIVSLQQLLNYPSKYPF